MGDKFMIDIQKAKRIFKNYVKNYNVEDGKIALKYNHILRVSEISRKIAESLQLSDEQIKLAELIGIFHDIGRFEQVKRYNTFVDKDSIDHGEYGVKLLFEDGLIEEFDIDKQYHNVIKKAVLNHNKKTIEDGLTDNELIHCKIIRDSDKLDIFHVLLTDDFINTYGTVSMEDETFSEEIIREFLEEHYIDYGKRQTYGDIWISHIAYVYDFYFPSSYIVLKKENYINRLLDKMQFKNSDTIEKANKIVKYANEFILQKILEKKDEKK